MTPPQSAHIIDFPTSISWFDEDGILCSIPKRNPPALNMDDAMEYVEKFKKEVGDNKVCIVVLASGSAEIPKRERDWIANEVAIFTAAMAIIFTSPMGRMIAKVFFAIKPPTYPVKFFSNEVEAKDWIRQFLPKKSE